MTLLSAPNIASNCAFSNAELLPSGGRQRVDARPPVRRRRLPRRGHPALGQHPLQRRVERPLFDLQRLFRQFVDVLGDGVPVHRLEVEGPQDQHLQGAGRDGRGIGRHKRLMHRRRGGWDWLAGRSLAFGIRAYRAFSSVSLVIAVSQCVSVQRTENRRTSERKN